LYDHYNRGEVRGPGGWEEALLKGDVQRTATSRGSNLYRRRLVHQGTAVKRGAYAKEKYIPTPRPNNVELRIERSMKRRGGLGADKVDTAVNETQRTEGPF